ncbi:MAG: rod shape-determining protein MreC [Janthinobacterium lividum]
MPLGTLDRSAPPLFNQGPSALSKLIFFSALALLLMVADARFHLVRPIRLAIGTVLYPVQWLALKPVQAVADGGRYMESLQAAQHNEAEARRAMSLQSERASQADALASDNARLRAMLHLRQTVSTPGRAAEVLYDAADPYTRKIVIDQGLSNGVAAGSPVIDEQGVLGQVTQVQPFTSEVTLVIDRDLAIPVQNMRTGARSVAFGDASSRSGGLELRFMAANSDLQEGDLLATSGVDGVYPAGLPVARIDRIERRADSGFARIYCVPLARVTAARYVLVLVPVGGQSPSAPAPAAADGAETGAAATPAPSASGPATASSSAALAAARRQPERASKPGTPAAAVPKPGSHAERRAILEKRRTP